MSNNDNPETTERIERTDVGYRLTVECTRGTGTRDQDKVKAELRAETPPSDREEREIVSKVTSRMRALRNFQPDGGDDE